MPTLLRSGQSGAAGGNFTGVYPQPPAPSPLSRMLVAVAADAEPPAAQLVVPDGIAADLTTGAPTVTPGAVSVSPSGAATATAAGAPAVAPGAVAVTPAGVAAPAAAGSPTIAPGPVTVTVAGIASPATPGEATVTSVTAVFPAGIPVAATAGTPTVTGVDVALISSLVDTFDDGVVDPVLWSHRYGDPVEVGGRGRVPCTTGFAAFQSAPVYTLAGSHVHARVWPPSAAGATTEAIAELLVLTTVGGTDAGFTVNAVGPTLKMADRSGYFDGSAVTIPYDPVAHAWLRLRETDGALLWETSPDGITWTTRRTSASPAWASDTTLSVALASHRDTGATDHAEFDTLNAPPPQTSTPAGIGAAATAGSPTVTPGPVAVGPAGIAAAATAGTPTVTAGAVTVTPGGITATFTAGTPTAAPPLRAGRLTAGTHRTRVRTGGTRYLTGVTASTRKATST